MGWMEVQAKLTPEQFDEIVRSASERLAGLPLSALRDRKGLASKASAEVQRVVKHGGYPFPSPAQLQALASAVVAKVGGLGFMDPLLPPATHEFTDVLLNSDGSVWVRRKGRMEFEKLDASPSVEEAWRVVEALLAPSGRACTEATPSVDAKIPRDPEMEFGGARVKVLHPAVAPGDGYPAIALRLYEPRPVPPEQIIQWGVLPQTVMDSLLEAVANRLRVMVVGGTSVGKTTLLSALCHGIPQDARIVKIEDPEEIWLPHPNVTTLEARPAVPGSDVAPYTVADGVDDAMRLAPTHVIVGEVRTGDAALSLFRALMSDHAGLTTFHAEGPEEAAFRLGVIMFADAQVRFEAAKGMFAEAIDLVVQVGWKDGVRKGLGVWEVEGVRGGNVKFRRLWEPGQETMEKPARRRG